MKRVPLFFAVLALSAAAHAANTPPTAKPASAVPAGAGGDGGARPKSASVVIEEIATDDTPPPPPVGEEKNAIGMYIRENTGERSPLQECYGRALEKRPTLQGKLVVRFDIGPNGKIIGANADGIQDRDLILCVVQVVRKWEFQKPQAGGKLRVAYPFKFEAKTNR